MLDLDQAACRKPENASTSFFPFPEDHEGIAAAKAVCSGCPVRAECLEENGHELYGVVAGLTERERWYLRRRQLAGRR